MVKSENEVRVFLLADFLTDGAEEMILVKEVAWKEGLCSFKNKKKILHSYTSSKHFLKKEKDLILFIYF